MAAAAARSHLRRSASGGPLRPRKRFGQHFLHDAGVLARIVEAVAPAPADRIVEIGPGEGALTRVLLERVPHLAEMLPFDTNTTPSEAPAQYALEMSAGWFDAHHVTEGVQVHGLPPAAAR